MTRDLVTADNSRRLDLFVDRHKDKPNRLWIDKRERILIKVGLGFGTWSLDPMWTKMVEARRPNHRWHPCSDLKLKGLPSPHARFRKAFSVPSSSLLRLTQAQSSQGSRETQTLAGVGWDELERGRVEHKMSTIGCRNCTLDLTWGLRISDGPSSDNLTPQTTTQQP